MENLTYENIKWIFSGIGCLILSVFIGKLVYNNNQKQKSGKNSTNIMSGRDMKIGENSNIGKDDKN